MVEITGATEPIGVTTPPTKEYSDHKNKDKANVTELLQKEKDRQPSHFYIKDEIPDRRGYKLRERICRKIFPSDTSTDNLLLMPHCMDQ